jgi:hypothetical protein
MPSLRRAPAKPLHRPTHQPTGPVGIEAIPKLRMLAHRCSALPLTDRSLKCFQISMQEASA